MAAHMLEVIKAYEIAEKTGYAVGDNASSNWITRFRESDEAPGFHTTTSSIQWMIAMSL
ncbi:hypothetical protein VFPPC_16373 [Pochonia chlamydosporia 170]|uniref:Uncharacterized protein n=1 Tax=Pochonia chlamydosporia 170 TaxID=1380566 RepID=A0A179FC82_METCM|nr:hypothetical protein VFPPC_16373 [Pochonia chlamydosporia 170]OAQ62719.1 hypothetical protein VFPPC_16373 [Pochonia chlamydosporia 170]